MIMQHTVLTVRCCFPRFSYIQDTEVREIVIPISTAYQGLTPDTLHSLFAATPENQSHLILALVDSDGTVSTQRLFNHVQPPEESQPPGATGQEPQPSSTET
jgi:hypothetical protein